MLILLSSGTRARYIDDIVRALALPDGAELQFRYSRSWLSASVVDKIDNRAIAGAKGLVCFIDQSTPGTIVYVPCRFVEISEVVELGSSLAISMIVGDFPHVGDADAIKTALAKNSESPKWEGDKTNGKYFFEQGSVNIRTAPSGDLVTWENIVRELLQRPEFAQKDRDFFFHVTRIATAHGDEVTPREGVFNFLSSNEYSISLYHFHPKDDPKSAKSIVLAPSTSDIKLFSPTEMPIDSRYDRKHWKFAAQGGLRSNRFVFELRTKSPKGEVHSQIEFSGCIGVNWKSLVIKATLTGFGVLVSAVGALHASGKLGLGTFAIAIFGAALAAIGAVYKN